MTSSVDSTLESLPIDSLRDDFERHPPMTPLVISAPTGSGKSTQIPRWCAARERTSALRDQRTPRATLVVEPRRVACRSLAARVAELEGAQLGREVGYTVRDEDRSRPETMIRFVTTGVALRLWSHDQLQSYGAVIIDEFHERNLELDLLLALCQAHPHTPLIVMSATFAAERLTEHLQGVHLSGEGRRFEVEVGYRPHGNTGPSPRGLIEGLLPLVEEAFTRGEALDLKRGGDVLVFLPGKGEIYEAERQVRQRWRALGVDQDREVVLLHGGLSLEEQSRVFYPQRRRRLILSTNVAETSLTVPRISVVIDSGLVRRTRYDRGRGALSLVEVAHDSAEQRRGRAGRLGPGLCLRMWSSGANLKPYTPPEIYRESLTSLLLAAAACGVSPQRLPFVDAPKAEALAEATQVLNTLGAIGVDGELTRCGASLFKLGVDVSLGRWLVEGLEGGPLSELIDLVSALSCSRPLFLRGRAAYPQEDLRQDGCDALGLIRALRVSPRDAQRHHLNAEGLREAQQHRERLCKALGVDARRDARESDVFAPINRRRLALALLNADPRCAYVSRERRGREAWCGLGPELSLGAESGLNLARTEDSRLRPEAILVLDQHAVVKSGRHAQHLITAGMPIPLEWMKQAGLGEERLGDAKLSRGSLTVERTRVFAKRVLESSWITPQGAQARRALAHCLLRGQHWPKLGAEIERRLSRSLLSAQLKRQAEVQGGLRGARRSLREPAEERDAPRDDLSVQAWLEERLALIGFEDPADLALLEEDDLLPEALPPQEEQQLDKAFPATLNLSDAHYVFHYQVSRRRVIMEQVSGSRRTPPRVEWLPKCGGFEIRFKRGQHDSALRARQRSR